MTFEEILEQTIAMLQRRGRLTYRALKRQFDLDDAYLDDLKHEIIEGQRLAVDEQGTVLVWTGEPASRASHDLFFQNDHHARSGCGPLHQSPRIWGGHLTRNQQI